MSEIEQKVNKAHKAIVDGLNLYLNGAASPPKFRREIAAAEYHEKLTEKNIRDGVVAFLLYNRMYSGSAADVDLYTLLNRYLLDRGIRQRINEVIKERTASA